VAATVIHRLVDRGLIGYDRPVAEYWPEFAAAGKEFITVRELMNHRAGLQRVRGLITGDGFLDHDTTAAALASARPDPRRLRSQGYHTVTFGALVVELAQRVTGASFPDLVQAELGLPLGDEDFWFRVPAEQRHRIAPARAVSHSRTSAYRSPSSPTTSATACPPSGTSAWHLSPRWPIGLPISSDGSSRQFGMARPEISDLPPANDNLALISADTACGRPVGSTAWRVDIRSGRWSLTRWFGRGRGW
jgi:CubicO group peptidase (beta-lactamase class C family)